ncbi:MAG: S8 family serine peptidase [Verrucomicrobiae bacterium]|nr:S8 family serine peptidase [Verrucomicrobiae bacterium]
MKHLSMGASRRRWGQWALVALMVLGWIDGAWAASREIRLRNERITPPPKAASGGLMAAMPVNGLYLVQFTGPLQPEWRAELAALGVELLWHVPEDAFVARLVNVSLPTLTARPYVHWVGEYRPDYKVLQGLFPAGLANAAEAKANIRVLLAPRASLAELAALRRLWPGFAGATRTHATLIWHGQATPRQVQLLAQSPAVLWVERAPQPRLYDEIATKIVAGEDGEIGTQALVHQLGFDGSGVTVSVADSGLDTGRTTPIHPDIAGRIGPFFYYGTLTDAADEHGHGTHVAGIIAGNAATGEKDEYGYLYGLGVAPGVRLVTQRMFDGAGAYEAPPSFATLTRDAVRAGAEIGSNSWGDDTHGRYDLSAMEFDALVRDADELAFGDQPYILEFSAGNAGPGAQTIGSPAVGKNVIATGASQNDRSGFFLFEDGIETMADFSSRGPCEDGRIKPDVVAPGTWIASLKSSLAPEDNAWAPISSYYFYMGGTSQAGPHVSGAAAVFVQYYRLTHTNQTPSPALVKAALIDSAWDMDDTVETGPVPNPDEGWGRVDLTELIGTERRHVMVDQTVPLRTGQAWEYRFVVSSGAEPLKVTLTYTDVPGLPAAIPALVNDLDLVVIGPDGTHYHGNQMWEGESAPNPPSYDNLNNVEGVRLRSPVPGQYTVRVQARNVPMDARADTPAVDQDFALVISGLLPIPGMGAVFMDRSFYRAPDVIKLSLFDSDLAGQPSVLVRIHSATETNGEPVTLTSAGTTGLFTGAVATATGPAASDTRLQLSHGDWIEARYFDASANVTRTATAQADFVPPVISAPGVTNRLGRMIISWTTDEPASGAVFFGTNLARATNLIAAPRRGLTQEVELLDLLPGQRYFFYLVAEDIAGNRRTNNNNGTGFQFIAVAAPTLLLVDDYVTFPMDDSRGVPLSAYTTALNASGISYDVWSVASRGYPTTNDLRAFKVVWWRLSDSLFGGLYGYQGLLSAQQNTLRAYVQSGGGLLLASMELLSRLGTSESSLAFKSNVLQVASFIEDAGVDTIQGVPFDSTTSGVLLDLDYTNYESAFLELLGQSPNVSDVIIPTTNAVPILYSAGTSEIVGIRYPPLGTDSTGRVVFLSFPMDAVPASGPAPNNRASLVRNLVDFLAPGEGGRGALALDRSHYTVPSQVIIEVGDSDLAGQGTLSVTARTTTATNGLVVQLTETVRRGLFRGFISLVAPSNAPAPGRLPSRHGDTLMVEYLDASANATLRSLALVDTVPPVIAHVLAEPDYEDITISWITSEPAEALVQYGESPSPLALTRTAYRATTATTHELLLNGLLPDKTYYFQVVSRDAAGNVAVDDNQGQYYAARTLRPRAVPFAEAFDVTDGGWSVFSSDDSMTEWLWGPPNNPWGETSAHSPPNAWGSNLNGRRLDWAETFLISPAINLTGGNQFKLRFWHSYDFVAQSELDILETGILYVFTNRLSDPVTLAEFYDASGGWTAEEIDLSPYAGRTVYLVWHYLLLSLEAENRAGWMVDDVSLTVSNVVPGTIVITNNLAQTLFALTGPVNRSGAGTFALVTNALPGDYQIQYSDVPYYVRPTNRNARLESGQTLVFTGQYTFPDVNQNGISDLWEQEFFGAAAPGYSGAGDRDGDGMTDYAEFIAGTNPTNALSRFYFTPPARQPDGSLQFSWSTVPGRGYRLHGTTNASRWFILRDWTRASSSFLTVPVAPATNPPVLWLRIEVQP